MRSRHAALLALALAGALALSPTLTCAGRKAVKPKPAPSLLTTEEHACQFWGDTYFWMATDRDAWIPITATIEKARQWAVSFVPQDPPIAAALAERLVNAARLVYATPTVSPAQTRYLMELRCMENIRTDDLRPDADRPWR
jgi:hypothetical protein